jgi:hypothetical protein
MFAPKQSQNPSQQPQNSPQQVYASLLYLGDSSRLTSHMLTVCVASLYLQMEVAVLVSRILMTKVIQRIDNTPQQSRNPLQQPRNPPQQLCASLQFSESFPADLSHFSGVLCSPKQASCSPDFDGEIHATDEKCTKAAS